MGTGDILRKLIIVSDARTDGSRGVQNIWGRLKTSQLLWRKSKLQGHDTTISACQHFCLTGAIQIRAFTHSFINSLIQQCFRGAPCIFPQCSLYLLTDLALTSHISNDSYGVDLPTLIFRYSSFGFD